jgi:integrase
MSPVRNKDGSRRAIARETVWRIIKAIAWENEWSGKVGTHNMHETLTRRTYTWSNDIRVVQRILGHRSGSSSLLVIQVHGSKIATSEERVANWEILVNQWRNEHSFRD